MPIPDADKPLETLREESIDQLIMNYGHGRLSRFAFEERLDKAISAHEHQQLIEISEDLELEVDEQFIQVKRAEMGSRYASAPRASKETFFNIFWGTTRTGNWKAPKTIYMINLFGGAELDFTEATFDSNDTTINIICVFGGVSLLINDNFKVKSRMLAFFGGSDNHSGSTSQPQGPNITIQGIALFGGVSTEIKYSLRESLRGFAKQIRNEIR